jgi:hypothetical protein
MLWDGQITDVLIGVRKRAGRPNLTCQPKLLLGQKDACACCIDAAIWHEPEFAQVHPFAQSPSHQCSPEPSGTNKGSGAAANTS